MENNRTERHLQLLDLKDFRYSFRLEFSERDKAITFV